MPRAPLVPDRLDQSDKPLASALVYAPAFRPTKAPSIQLSASSAFTVGHPGASPLHLLRQPTLRIGTMNVDPITQQPLPASAIQRVLYLSSRAHIYQIPPLRSTKGHSASQWTAQANPTAKEIFTARIRIIETAVPRLFSGANSADPEEDVKVHVLLEDPKEGTLFAAAPYDRESAVEPAIDSSRFFAITVVGERNMKAVLGLGFEERAEAVDFSIALQDARRVLGIEKPANGVIGGSQPGSKSKEVQKQEGKRDFSLKEGETIHVEIPGGGRRRKVSDGQNSTGADSNNENLDAFKLAPPGRTDSQPSQGSDLGAFKLAPPPTVSEVKSERRRSRNLESLGFDDGEFGEFQ